MLNSEQSTNCQQTLSVDTDCNMDEAVTTVYTPPVQISKMMPPPISRQEPTLQINKPQNKPNKSLPSSTLTNTGSENKEGSHEASGKRKREQEVTRNSVKTRPLRRSVRGRFNLSNSM